MNKRFWLWMITIVLLLVSLPGLFNRWSIESGNNTYEIALPYHEIFDLTKEDTVTIDDALSSLKEAGLNAVSVSPLSINEMSKLGIISLLGQTELEKALKYTHKPEEYKQEKIGYYATVPEDDYYADIIVEHFNPVELTINDEDFYFISEEKDVKDNKEGEDEDTKNRATNLGYDKNQIDVIKSHQLNYILRIENDPLNEINEQTISTFLDYKDDPDLSTVLFSGTSVIGYPNISKVKENAITLHQAGYNFYTIEFANQNGLKEVARVSHYDTIKLISINLNKDTDTINTNRVIRAVKERNIRTVFLHIINGESKMSLEHTTDFITSVHDNMPEHFIPGTPAPLKGINSPLWSLIAALAAGILFTTLIASTFNIQLLEYATIILMTLLAMGYFILQKILFLQAFALILAIITPVYAVLGTVSNPTTSIRMITLKYVKATCITIAGLIIILGTLNSNGFISGFELFRGVKLLYTLPLLLVAFILIWDKQWKKSMNLSKGKELAAFLKDNELVSILKGPVKYSHLLVLAIVGGLSYYYISRTGNSGSVSNFEIIFRDTLEQILYVRPRTKEFLIGLPIYIVAIYIMSINKKWGKFLLIPGVIGFLSIINTFTHLHIPLSISVLRTVYGIVFGYLFGLLFIYIFSLGYRYVPRLFKKR